MKLNISLKLRALRIYFEIGSNARIDYERLVEQQRLDKISQGQQLFDRISQKAHAYSLGKSFGVSDFGQNAEIVNFHASPKSRPVSFGLKNEGIVLVEYDTNDPEHADARIDYERLVEQQRLDKISQEQQLFDRISQKAQFYSK